MDNLKEYKDHQGPPFIQTDFPQMDCHDLLYHDQSACSVQYMVLSKAAHMRFLNIINLT